MGADLPSTSSQQEIIDDTDSIGSEKLPVDEVLERVTGSFGRFQLIALILVSAPIICVSLQGLSWTFVGSEQIFPGNASVFAQWDIEPAHRPYIKATVQSCYFLGQVVGSYVTGVMGDSYGRIYAIYFSLIIQAICALLPSFAPNWWTFSLLKLGTGFSEAGLYGIATLYGLEILGKAHRRLCVIVATVFAVIGMMCIPLGAWYIKDQRIYHAVLASPSFIFMLYFWALPESPRWLIAKGRMEEAEKVVRRIAAINKRSVPKDWISNLDITPTDKETSSPGVRDLFRTPEMRKRILVLTFFWPTGSMLYYGMSLKSDLNGGSLYLSFALSSLMEIPGTVIFYFVINIIGRRLLLSGSLMISGFLLLANWGLADVAPNYMLLSIILICKIASTCIANGGYTHTPEMMPTLLRTTALGYCSAVARVGSILASCISFWLVDNYGMVALIVPFSVCSIVASILVQTFLPETMGRPMPETIEDVEKKAL